MAGRPRHHEEAKRSALNLRTSPELRDRIEASAAQRGLSRTQEVERVLVEYYRDQEWLGGSATAAFVRMLGASIDMIERRSGAPWTDDITTWRSVRTVVEAGLESIRPDRASEMKDIPTSEGVGPEGQELSGYSRDEAGHWPTVPIERFASHSVPSGGADVSRSEEPDAGPGAANEGHRSIRKAV